MEQPNEPTLVGYLELLVKVMISMILLIIVGISTAIVVLAVPFILSFVFVLALVGAGFFVFSWNYVFVGTIALLILLGMTLQ